MDGYPSARLDYHCVRGATFYSRGFGRPSEKGCVQTHEDHRRSGDHLCLCLHSDHTILHRTLPRLDRHLGFLGQIFDSLGSGFFSLVP